MPRKIFFLLFSISLSGFALAQKPVKQQPAVDTLFTDYDALFSELDAFLDSLIAPRNFTLFNVGVSSAIFNFETKESFLLVPSRRMVYTPSLSFYSKSGLGVAGTVSIVNDGRRINPYQFYVSGLYDYLKNRKFITGISLTRFFTKDSLLFYTSPLQNEAYAYFTYRNFWLRPTVAVSYGWGSRTDYVEREEYITSFRLRPTGFTRINIRESVNDFSLTTSVRHDFYWLNVISQSDYVRVTPQLTYVSGTQKFGFNQTSNTYATVRGSGAKILYNSENTQLDDQLYFQPLSLSAFIKTEYSIGKFFLQPQLVFDYYFPAKSKNFSTAFLINGGVIF